MKLPSLTPSQAAVILGVLALGGWLAYLLPGDTLTRVAIGLLTLLGAGGTAMPGPSAGTPSTPPPPPPPNRVSGHAHLDALLWVAAVGAVLWAWLQRAGIASLFALSALAFAGCGAATGGAAGVALAAKPILDTTCAGARVACRLIDSACSAYEDATAPLSEDTSGGEAP